MDADHARPTRVLVVGGGVTGLAAAHRLVEFGMDPLVLERAPRCGGVILTERVDGFLIEAGPDSFLARKPWAADLCRRIGLGDEIIPTDPANLGSFLLVGGRLHPLPEGLTSLVPTRLGPIARTRLLSPAAKVRLLLEPLLPRGAKRDDESLASFFRRRLGGEASRRLVEPLVRGIYGGDPETLSLRATFPQLAELERRDRSLVLGLLRQSHGRAREAPADPGAGAALSPPLPASASSRGIEAAFLSLRDGMGSLADGLVGSLPSGTVRIGRNGVALRRRPDGSFDLELQGGEVETAAAVILATPPGETRRLLAPLDPELASLVGGIRSGSSVTVAFGLERDQVGHPLRGHGFIVPQTGPGPILACTWASSKLTGRAPAESVLVRAFLVDPESLIERGEAELSRLALEALRPILRISGSPRLARVHRWPEALPRYAVGHPARLAAIERRLALLPGLFLVGAAYRGVGIPDCVRDGEAAAAAACAHLQRSAAAATGAGLG